MLEFLKRMANRTATENGGAALVTTGSDCLDFFAAAGALRSAEEGDIVGRFLRAWAEDANSAMKLLFYARDVRGGLGERRVFRAILKWLAVNQPESVIKNLDYVSEFGRYDDLLTLMDTPCENAAIALMKKQLEADLASLSENGEVSLLAKWLPSVNASDQRTNAMGKKLARAFGMKEAVYRKSLSALRARIRIIENALREKDYTFDYSAQPSRAMFKYRRAFRRNDGERYNAFLNRVSAGKATLHADNVAPYELVQPYLTIGYGTNIRSISAEERKTLNATWASLTDFGGNENALTVIDTSGSMYGYDNARPAAVALSLGIYFAERSKGLYHNHFIEFSARPELIELKGETFADKLCYAASFSQIANTNLQAVFELVLRTAVFHKVRQSEMPAKLIIISDMEFDACVDNSNETVFENAKRRYEAHGYKLPQVVFWNVAARGRRVPVSMNEQGVTLVSGVTPRLFSMVAGGSATPMQLMRDVLASERYAPISA